MDGLGRRIDVLGRRLRQRETTPRRERELVANIVYRRVIGLATRSRGPDEKMSCACENVTLEILPGLSPNTHRLR